MAIAATLAWQPVSASILGPPDLMYARANITGDASGGNIVATIPLAGGFVWLPLWVELDTVNATAEEVLVQYTDATGGQEALIGLNSAGAGATVPVFGTESVFRVDWPRGLVVRSDDTEIRCTFVNTDTQIWVVQARSIRYPAQGSPQLWQQFMTQPQGGP